MMVGNSLHVSLQLSSTFFFFIFSNSLFHIFLYFHSTLFLYSREYKNSERGRLCGWTSVIPDTCDEMFSLEQRLIFKYLVGELRDHLVVGCNSLKVVTLVRIQVPQPTRDRLSRSRYVEYIYDYYFKTNLRGY